MIIDNDLMFSNAQEVTVTAASSAVDVGEGDLGVSPLELVVLVNSAASGAGSLVIELQTSATESGTYETLVASRSLIAADLEAGASLLPIRIPHGAKRWLKLKYTVTGALTGLKLTGFMVIDRHSGTGK